MAGDDILVSSADIITMIASVAVAVVAVIGGIWALIRFVFLAPILRRLDTITYLLGQHRHGADGSVLAPIRGGANGEDAN